MLYHNGPFSHQVSNNRQTTKTIIVPVRNRSMLFTKAAHLRWCMCLWRFSSSWRCRRSLITGRGGYKTGAGASEVLPQQRGRKGFSHAEGGGAQQVLVLTLEFKVLAILMGGGA